MTECCKRNFRVSYYYVTCIGFNSQQGQAFFSAIQSVCWTYLVPCAVSIDSFLLWSCVSRVNWTLMPM